MDTINQKSNAAKSFKGAAFNRCIKEILNIFFKAGDILKVQYEPKYGDKGYKKLQYAPDVEITLKNGNIIVIDNTTSIRSDRLKQKQWDALGAKRYFNTMGKSIKYFVVIPNSYTLGSETTNKDEVGKYITQRLDIVENKKFSAIDDILELDELIHLIETSSSIN